MKDSQEVSTHEGQDLAARIEAAILTLADAMRVYADHVQPERPRFKPESARLMLRHAPRTPETDEIFRAETGQAQCGLTRHPGHLLLRVGAPAPSSHHAAMGTAWLAREATRAAEALADILKAIPLLAHNALQIEATTHWPREGRDELSLGIEGVSLSSDPRPTAECAAAASARLSALARIRPGPASAPWPFYEVQGFLVRAPGPGWAHLKLHALNRISPLTPEKLARFLAEEPPRVLRVEPHGAIEADLAGLRLL